MLKDLATLSTELTCVHFALGAEAISKKRSWRQLWHSFSGRQESPKGVTTQLKKNYEKHIHPVLLKLESMSTGGSQPMETEANQPDAVSRTHVASPAFVLLPLGAGGKTAKSGSKKCLAQHSDTRSQTSPREDGTNQGRLQQGGGLQLLELVTNLERAAAVSTASVTERVRGAVGQLSSFLAGQFLAVALAVGETVILLTSPPHLY